MSSNIESVRQDLQAALQEVETVQRELAEFQDQPTFKLFEGLRSGFIPFLQSPLGLALLPAMGVALAYAQEWAKCTYYSIPVDAISLSAERIVYGSANAMYWILLFEVVRWGLDMAMPRLYVDASHKSTPELHDIDDPGVDKNSLVNSAKMIIESHRDTVERKRRVLEFATRLLPVLRRLATLFVVIVFGGAVVVSSRQTLSVFIHDERPAFRVLPGVDVVLCHHFQTILQQRLVKTQHRAGICSVCGSAGGERNSPIGIQPVILFRLGRLPRLRIRCQVLGLQLLVSI